MRPIDSNEGPWQHSFAKTAMRWHHALYSTTTILPWTDFTEYAQKTLQTVCHRSPSLTDLLSSSLSHEISLQTAAESVLLLLEPAHSFTQSYHQPVTSALFHPCAPSLPSPSTHDTLTPSLSVTPNPTCLVNNLPAAHTIPSPSLPCYEKRFWSSGSSTAEETASELQFVFSEPETSPVLAAHFAKAITAACLSLSGCSVALLPNNAAVCLRLCRSKAEHRGIAVRISGVFQGFCDAPAAVAGLLSTGLRMGRMPGAGAVARTAAMRVSEICCVREGRWRCLGMELLRKGGGVVGRGRGIIGVSVGDRAIMCWDGEWEGDRGRVEKGFERVVSEGWGRMVDGKVLIVDVNIVIDICQMF